MGNLYIKPGSLIKSAGDPNNGYIAEAKNIKYDNSYSIQNKIDELYELINNLTPTPPHNLILSSNSIEIRRPQPINGISIPGNNSYPNNITIMVNESISIQNPNRLSISYGQNNDGHGTVPSATYDGIQVIPTWTSSNDEIASVVDNNDISGKSQGSAILTATYNSITATCNVEVINDDSPTEITSGWEYISMNTSIAEVNNNIIIGKGQGTTAIKIKYRGVQCDFINVTVEATPQTTYYWYVGTTQPNAVNDPSTWRTTSNDAGFTINPNISSSDKIWVAYPNSWTLEITDADGYGVGNDYLSASIKNSINGYLINRFTADSNTSAWAFKFIK